MGNLNARELALPDTFATPRPRENSTNRKKKGGVGHLPRPGPAQRSVISPCNCLTLGFPEFYSTDVRGISPMFMHLQYKQTGRFSRCPKCVESHSHVLGELLEFQPRSYHGSPEKQHPKPSGPLWVPRGQWGERLSQPLIPRSCRLHEERSM